MMAKAAVVSSSRTHSGMYPAVAPLSVPVSLNRYAPGGQDGSMVTFVVGCHWHSTMNVSGDTVGGGWLFPPLKVLERHTRRPPRPP